MGADGLAERKRAEVFEQKSCTSRECISIFFNSAS